MNAQSEEMARQLHAARLERVNIQRMRLLATKRAEKLERELKAVTETGLRVEISRGIDARARLHTVVRRKRSARYAAVGAFALMLCAATLGLAWNPAQTSAVPDQRVSQAPVLAAQSGDRLKLALSYSVSPPATR